MRFLHEWLERRRTKYLDRIAELDGQILRPACEKAARLHHPDYTDAEIAVVVDQMMERHYELEQGYNQ